MLGITITHVIGILMQHATSNREPLSVFLFYTEDKGNGNTPIGNRLYRYELEMNKLIKSKIVTRFACNTKFIR